MFRISSTFIHFFDPIRLFGNVKAVKKIGSYRRSSKRTDTAQTANGQCKVVAGRTCYCHNVFRKCETVVSDLDAELGGAGDEYVGTAWIKPNLPVAGPPIDRKLGLRSAPKSS